MTGFAELDLAARVAVARARLAPLALQLRGDLTLEDTSGVTTLEARAADDDDGLLETVPPESFVACRFCAGRFLPGPSARCPHCGAPL